MSKPVDAWLRRTRKKGPFYLWKTSEIRYFVGWDYDADPQVQKYSDGHSYIVIWRHDGKVRIGALKDGMHTRYGFDTYGTLVGDTIAGFWQPSPGFLSEEEMREMIAVAKGECKLPTFDPIDLKDLSE